MNDLLGNPSLVVILGVLAPVAISALKRPDWPQWAKQALAIGVSVAVGLAAVALRVEASEVSWGVDTVVGHVATVLLVAQAVYWFLLSGEPKPGAAPAVRLNGWLEQLGTKPPALEPPEVKP